MKIYIDTETWTRIKEETEYPVLTGNNYVDKITVCYNSNPTNFYPTLNILKPNNRKVGPIMFDSNEQYPASFTDDDNNTWYYFDFTLSSNESQIDVAGKYNITITTHKTSSGVEVSQRNINTFLTVKNAVINDDGDILILSDEEDTSTVVASLRTLITQLQTLYTSLGSSKADRVGPLQDIFAKTLTAFVQLTTKYLEAAANNHYLKFYYDSGDDYYYFDVKVDDIELVSLNDIILKNTGHFKVVDTLNDHKLDFTDGELTIDEVKIPNKTYVDTAKSNLMDLINGIKNGTSINSFSATESALGQKVGYSDVKNDLISTDTTKPLSAYQGKVLKGLIDALETLVSSDDTDLDTLQEIVAYIKNNKDLIDSITTSKVSVTDIIDNLTSEISNKPLSAKQGYVLKGMIDDLNDAETGIEAAEALRVQAEAGRVSAEEDRVAAELLREATIANLQDGANIDSFGDVETALGTKQDTLSGSTSIDITSNVVSVKDSYVNNFFATSEEIDTMLEEVFG